MKKALHQQLTNKGITSAGVLVGILFVVLLGLGGWYAYQSQKETPAPTETQQQSAETITYAGQDGKTALELLQEKNTTVVVKESAVGKFVESINGVKGGTDGKYWMFYINGEPAQIGAGEYRTTSQDQIEWRFEQ